MDSGRDKQSKGPRNSKASQGSKDPKGKEALTPGDTAVDSRGRNVWHFHGESIDNTSMMLQKLDNPSLALEPTRKTRQLDSHAAAATGQSPAGKLTQKAAGKSPREGEGSPKRKPDLGGTTESFEQRYQVKSGGKKPGGGFDPYNRS